MDRESASRLILLLGEEKTRTLARCRVAVFGLGGVGSYAAEALGRSGIGRLDLVDGDTVAVSNINRQLPAMRSTLGRYKAEVTAARLRDVNPDADIRALPVFYDGETASGFDFSAYDYIVDAIDSVSSKLLLIEKAAEAGTPIISSMGAGNRLDPAAFRVTDIYSTSVCPLARVMRRELRKRGVERLKVVCSDETPLPAPHPEEGAEGKAPLGSAAFVTGTAGLLLASQVIKDLCGIK